MEYKALEDLINILIRKTGNNLNDEVLDYRKTKLENRLKEIKSDSNVLLYTEEIDLINQSLTNWDNEIKKVAKEILVAFKDKKPYGSVRDKVEFLVTKANQEESATDKEIEDTNIFEVIETYKKDLSDIRNKIDENDDKDRAKESNRNFYVAYNASKAKSLEKRNDTLQEQIKALDKIIHLLNEEVEKIGRNISVIEEKILSFKNKIYLNKLTFNSKEDVDRIDELLKENEEEIESLRNIESKYLKDISEYKNDQVVKKEEIFSNKKQLENLKEVHIETRNNVDTLNDELKYYTINSRLNSLSLEQQYLYVDPLVIKEEIRSLWNKNNPSDIEYFEI